MRVLPGRAMPIQPVRHSSKQSPWHLSAFSQMLLPPQMPSGCFIRALSPPGWWQTRISPHPNWDRYYVEAAVKPDYESSVGLLAAYQDERNYLLFRWHPESSASNERALLIAMIDGKGQTLAACAKGFSPEQWYRIRLNIDWQHVEVLLDDAVLLVAKNIGAVEGRIGLYADNVKNPRRPVIDQATTNLYAGKSPDTGAEVNALSEVVRSVELCIFR